ncbi:MAG TPA: hypothetical protein VGM39_24215 [Kofleriaceae bacterium]
MLDKPSHLQPEAGGSTWLAARPASAITAAVGLLAFVIAAVTSNGIGSMPDLRVTIPGLVVVAMGCVAAVARKEKGGYPLWLAGLGLAAVAAVLGWFLMVAIVVAATAILILIIHALM